jgi:colanic acid/amylovoran biosynthesis glycosyltransferase
MVIGLILNSAPGYSETFFRNKIRFLQEAGLDVIVFADNSNTVKSDYRLVSGFRWKGNLASKFRHIVVALLRLLNCPLKALKLFLLNKKDGFSMKTNCLSLLTSAHILGFKLDWLHFGFATVALGRENLGKVLQSRLAVSIRGYDLAIYPQKYPNCYQLLWKRTDKLHHLSDELYSLAIGQGIFKDTLHQKITSAIDISLFTGLEFAGFPRILRFVTIARLHWVKGLDYTLEALRLLAEKGIEFEYTLVGEGKDYERLVFACYQLGITERVNFVGKKGPSEIKQILAESDIYIQYSIHEGFCNATLEAQAMGLLCVCSDGGGLGENLLHEQTGWIVPKRNPQALADQIMNILKLPEFTLQQISLNAAKRAKTVFGLQKQEAEFLEFYR